MRDVSKFYGQNFVQNKKGSKLQCLRFLCKTFKSDFFLFKTILLFSMC